MPRCRKCGGHAEKVHRRGLEKLFFPDAFRCQECKRRTRRFSLRWSPTLRFLFSRYSVCVRCGTRRVKSVHRRDPIEDLSKHPFSLVQAIFLAPRKHCSYCRLQYFDVRGVAPRISQTVRSSD
jgi:hypothetical protein